MCVPSVEAVRITIDILNVYKQDDSIECALNPACQLVSPEDFLERHFAENVYSDELQDMVTEFFFRITKHRKYLEKIVDKYVKSKASWAVVKPNDLFTYIAFLYLLVVELNERTKDKIENILISINDRKALSLLTFFKRKDILAKLYEWGCQIWDVDYVTKMLENAVRRPLYEDVHQTLTDHFEKIKTSKVRELTVPVGPKCLTRPRRTRSVAAPETVRSQVSATRIPVCIKASRTPSSTYVQPVEVHKLEEERARNREQALNLFEEAQKKAYRCANPEKSDRFKESTRRIEEDRQTAATKKITYKKIKAKEVATPKKTAAVILREGARLLKLEHDEIKRYEDLARGGFNDDLIAELEEEIREENIRKHLEYIERKHLEGLLSYEEALLAKQKFLKKRKEQADELKKEEDAWLKQLEEWRRDELCRLQEAVEKEKASEKLVKEAVEQVREEKHKMAMETAQESKALYERRMKEREEDLQRKVQMIKEIKALQAFGAIRRKEPNLTETANLGFLCEMSIAELKERLFILRIELQEELEKRRAEIKVKRECRKEILDSYQELIESHKQITREQKRAPTRDTNEEEVKQRQICQSSPALDDLRRKLYVKRRERMKYQMVS